MNKYIKNLIIIILCISVVANVLTCFVYWILNPEFSQMQVFLKFWYWFLINICFSLYLILFIDK